MSSGSSSVGGQHAVVDDGRNVTVRLKIRGNAPPIPAHGALRSSTGTMPPVSTAVGAVGGVDERLVGDLALHAADDVDERLVGRPRAEAGEAVPVEVGSVVLLERGAVVVPHRPLDVRVRVHRDAVLGELGELGGDHRVEVALVAVQPLRAAERLHRRQERRPVRVGDAAVDAVGAVDRLGDLGAVVLGRDRDRDELGIVGVEALELEHGLGDVGRRSRATRSRCTRRRGSRSRRRPSSATAPAGMAKFEPVTNEIGLENSISAIGQHEPNIAMLLLLEDRDQLAGVERERADEGDDALVGGLAAAVGVLVGVAAAVAQDDLERAAVDPAAGVDPLAVDARRLVDVRVRRQLRVDRRDGHHLDRLAGCRAAGGGPVAAGVGWRRGARPACRPRYRLAPSAAVSAGASSTTVHR